MLRGCLWVVGGLFSLLVLAAVLGKGSRDRPAPATLPAAETGNVIHQFAPPADFRGINCAETRTPKIGGTFFGLPE